MYTHCRCVRFAFIATLLPSIGVGIDLTQSVAAGPPSAQIRTSQSTTLATTQSADDNFDLAAFIKGLNPPMVEQIIKGLEPIPTLRDVIKPRSNDLNAPFKHSMTGDDKSRVDQLAKQIKELREQAKYSEAVPLAEEVATTRKSVQGQVHWETLDSRQLVETLRRAAAMPEPEQAALAAADAAEPIIEVLFERGRYDDVLVLVRRQLSVRIRLLGIAHIEAAITIRNSAGLLSSKGDDLGAESLYRQALAIRCMLLGTDHPQVAESLNDLGVSLRKHGNYADADLLLRKALAIRRNLLGDMHSDVATNMDSLALLLQEKGDYAAAEPLCREALALRRRLVGSEHKDVATSLNNLAALLLTKGDYSAAEPLFGEALAVNRKIFGNEHPAVATSSNNLAYLLNAKGDYDAAESLFREALAVNRKIFGNEHPAIAINLSNLATLLVLAKGDYAAAEPLLREALALNRKLFGGESQAVALNLHNLATLLADAKNDYAGAETLCRQALAIRYSLFGKGHREVAANLNNLGVILKRKGDFTAAERLMREALEMRLSLVGNEHPDVAESLDSLASLLQDNGDYAGAEPLNRQTLAIYRRLHGNEHPNVANSLNNLAYGLNAKGDYAAAEPLFREALAVNRKIFGNEHPTVATSLNNLASLLVLARSDYAATEPLLREALAIYRKHFGNCHANVATTLNSLATIFYAQGHYAGAEPLYCESVTITDNLRTLIVGGERERAEYSGRIRLSRIAKKWAMTLVHLARCNDALGAIERGRDRAFLDLLTRKDVDILAAVRASGDRKQIAELEGCLRLEETHRTTLTGAEATLAATQRRKDLPDEDMKKLIEHQSQAIEQGRRELQDATTAVLTLLREVWPDAKPLGPKAIRAALTPGELILCYAWTEDGLTLLTVPPAGTGEVHGIVLADGKKAMQELGDLTAEVIGQLSRRAGSDKTSASDVFQKLYDALIGRAPPAMRKEISSVRRLIILPDGPLTGIPFEALIPTRPASENHDFVSCDAEIVYSASATAYANRRNRSRSEMLARARKGGASNVTALVLGDPIFDWNKPIEPDVPEDGALIAMAVPDGPAAKAGLSRGDVLLTYDDTQLKGTASTTAVDALTVARDKVDKAIQAGRRGANEPVKATYWRAGVTQEVDLPPGKLGVQLEKSSPKEGLQYLAMLTRGEAEKIAEVSALDQIRFFGDALPSLPGTRREAEAISQVVHSAGGDVTLLLGEEATLGKFTSAVPGRRIVHLATHGLTGSAERPYDASLALTQPKTPSLDDIGFLRLDDMIRSWRGKLNRCELVVLSACDTQRGIKKGDSLMALPWGFFYAGAPTVIASLWKVDDTATALLMQRFYENLLGQFKESRMVAGQAFAPDVPMPKATALREAKLWLRGLPPRQAEALVRQLLKQNTGQPTGTSDLARADESIIARGGKGDTPVGVSSQRDPFNYSHPYFWAAFILIGDPE